jgi:hypothetical protein
VKLIARWIICLVVVGSLISIAPATAFEPFNPQVQPLNSESLDSQPASDALRISFGEIKDILLLIGISGGINKPFERGSTKIDLVRTSTKLILKAVDPAVNCGLRTYGGGSQETDFNVHSPLLSGCKSTALAVPIGNGNRKKILKVLEDASPMGPSPLTYALNQALKGELSTLSSASAIVLITNGHDGCGGSLSRYAKEASKAGMLVQPIFVLTLVDSETNAWDFTQLQDLVKVSGGKLYNMTEFDSLLHDLSKCSHSYTDIPPSDSEYLQADACAIESLWQGLAEKSSAVNSAISQLSRPHRLKHSPELAESSFCILPFLRLFEMVPGITSDKRASSYVPSDYLGMRSGKDAPEVFDTIRKNAMVREVASNLILTWHAYERLVIRKTQGELEADNLVLSRLREELVKESGDKAVEKAEAAIATYTSAERTTFLKLYPESRSKNSNGL